MEISHPSHPELTPEQQQQFDQLKSMVQQAVADGVITQGEYDRILAQIWADGKPSFEELALLRSMISEKVACGELAMDHCDNLAIDQYLKRWR